MKHTALACALISGTLLWPLSLLASAPDTDNDGVPDYIDADPQDAGITSELQFILDGNYTGGRIREHNGLGDFCTFGLGFSPGQASVPDTASALLSFNVVEQDGCSWSASTTTPWLSIVSGSGTGNGTVSYTVEANLTTSPRTATIHVGSGAFTVTQAGACTYSIAPTSRTVTNACSLQSSTATVTAGAGCTWSAASSNGQTGWLKIVSGGGPRAGTGTGQSLTFSTASNRHQDARSGTITVLDGNNQPTTAVLTVTQVHGHACP